VKAGGCAEKRQKAKDKPSGRLITSGKHKKNIHRENKTRCSPTSG